MSRAMAMVALVGAVALSLAVRPDLAPASDAVQGTAQVPDRALSARLPRPESKVELFVGDVDASIAFYRRLGFDVAHAKEDGYTTLNRGSFVMALSPLPGWLPLSWLGFLRSPPLGTELVFYVSDLEVHQALLEEAGDSPGAIKLQPWGDRDLRVDDPDGYYVRVSEGSAIPGMSTATDPDSEPGL